MNKKEKQRIDSFIYQQGKAKSREQAAKLVMAGCVYFNSQKITKPSFMVDLEQADKLIIKSKPHQYVSRGGLKLEKAINVFNIDVKDKVCMDVGASTGGFTHCLLINGAKKVYAIDVGYNQLDWQMRSDARVVTLERRNARLMKADWFEDKIEFGCMDVSFISIKLILPNILKILENGSYFVALIKPQFEAGKENVGKNGVVRDAKVHKKVIEEILGFVNEIGFLVEGLNFSPITGPKGNIEFLLLLKKSDKKEQGKYLQIKGDVDNVISGANEFHKNNSRNDEALPKISQF